MNGLLAEAKVGEDNMTLAIQHDINIFSGFKSLHSYMIKSMEQEMEGKISLKLEENVTQNIILYPCGSSGVSPFQL